MPRVRPSATCPKCGKEMRKDSLRRHVESVHTPGGKGHDRSLKARQKREEIEARREAQEAKRRDKQRQEEERRAARTEAQQARRRALRGGVDVKAAMASARAWAGPCGVRTRSRSKYIVPLYVQWVAFALESIGLRCRRRHCISRTGECARQIKQNKKGKDRLRRRIKLDEMVYANRCWCEAHTVWYYPRCRSRLSAYWGQQHCLGCLSERREEQEHFEELAMKRDPLGSGTGPFPSQVGRYAQT